MPLVCHIFGFPLIFNIVTNKQREVNSVTKLKTYIENPSCTANIVIISSDCNSNLKQTGTYNGKFNKVFNKQSFSEVTSASNVTWACPAEPQCSLFRLLHPSLGKPLTNSCQSKRFTVLSENTDEELTEPSSSKAFCTWIQKEVRCQYKN